MEVDSPPGLGAPPGDAPSVISDSGSSTEVEEDEDDGGQTAGAAPRLPSTWAFSQRAASSAAAAPATQGPPLRRRVRQGLRVHYPSQTAAPSTGFPDFLLRAPAAGAGRPESGSTTEVSDSEEEDAGGAEGPADREVEEPPQEAPPSDSRSADGTPAPDPLPQPLPTACAPAPPPCGEEGEGDSCTICFEAWTAAGEHRLSALRCGHLFGFTCIQRWLKAQGAAGKCPQVSRSHSPGLALETPQDDRSVPVPAPVPVSVVQQESQAFGHRPAVRAQAKGPGQHRAGEPEEVSEEQTPWFLVPGSWFLVPNPGLLRSLEQEQSLRRKAELESAQYKLKLQVVANKYGRAQEELQELKALIAGRGSLPSSSPASSFSSPSSLVLGVSQRLDGSRTAQYSFSKAVLVSQGGGCRVLAYCEPLSCLLASQPSPHSTLLPGFGIKKVSVVSMKASQYVPVHSKQIRGLSFNGQQDSLLLSAALDNTVKLTSLLTNTVVQTYNAGRPVWSCCWSLDNSNYVYAGLNNGSVLVYDTRDTSTHVHELQPLRSRCPVASLCYVPRAASSAFPCGGLIAGSLEGACFWEQVSDTYRPHVLPLEAGGCIDIQVEAESRHCLVTYRPGRANPALRCVLMALTRTPLQDSAQPPSCSCSPVQTFAAGSSCKLLTKNAVFRSPAGSGTLVCAGDEASSSTMVWDAGSGSLLQKLPADLPVLDVGPFAVNGEHFLASLTEKMLKLYRWE
ncbi:unnamed protein product [Tetraodon nigroviridis]|uniref:RING-type E3 ubiquitin transferase n=1 Tax=Tetraodon nigroviridis TaxID=99883 RepID=Q4SE48_TETNG|nr:unnamed protein product [Tetraodon nigroviridis]